MAKYRNHICIMSEQNTAELLGALMPGSEKPKIHAIVSEKMKEKAAIFRAACEAMGLKCEFYDLGTNDAAEVEKICEGIRASVKYDNIAVNITGGTKIMALGAYGWAARNKIPAFYVDTAQP